MLKEPVVDTCAKMSSPCTIRESIANEACPDEGHCLTFWVKHIYRTKQESHQLGVTTLPNIDNTIGSDTEAALYQTFCSTSHYWVRKIVCTCGDA